MKIIIKLFLSFFIMYQICGCKKVDERSYSSDTSIKSISVRFVGTERYYQGEITDDQITFEVPIYASDVGELVENDLSRMELVASLPVGTVIESGLEGVRDLTQPASIRVMAAGGESKEYHITVKKTGMNYTVGLLEFGVTKLNGTLEYQSTQVAPYQDGDRIIIEVPNTSKEPLDLTKLQVRIKLQPTCSISPNVNGTIADFTEPMVIQVTDGKGTLRTHTIEIRPTKFNKTKFTQLWFRSIEDLGLTRTNIRSFALAENHFYIGEFEDWSLGKIHSFNTENGQATGKIDQPTTFATQISGDSNGNIAITTKNEFGKGYEFWRFGETNNSYDKLFTFVSWDPLNIEQFGVNKTTITGNIRSGKAYTYTTMPNGQYYSWELNNGVPVSSVPKVVKYDVLKTGGSWDIALVKRANTTSDSDLYISWYNDGANENDGKGSRFEIQEPSGATYQLNPKSHGYKILAYDVFTVQSDTFVAMLTQGKQATSEARLVVFEITDKSKLSLMPGQTGYEDLKVFESGPLGISTDFTSGDLHAKVKGFQVDIFVGLSAISNQSASNAGIRKYRMDYLVE